MPRQDERQFLNEILLGRQDAVECVEMVSRISQVLDDLIDRDRYVDPAVIFEAFWEAMIELPGNSFYRQHEPHLRPVLAGVMQDWWDSTRLESTSSKKCHTIAFVIRDNLATFIVQCARLVGGAEYARGMGAMIRMHCHEDSFNDYVKSLEEI